MLGLSVGGHSSQGDTAVDLLAISLTPFPFPNTVEIDITCWDADPVPEEEEGFEGGD